MVVVGGVIPPQDYDFLKKSGADRRVRAGHLHPGRSQGNAGAIVRASGSMTASEPTINDYVSGVLAGNRAILSRAVTLIESQSPLHEKKAQEVLLELLPHTGKSRRIGITGAPGVGKSTFIEAFGCYLVKQGRSVAVLAIDPSSKRSGGSILGDKTRMENLSREPRAFIRPSPSGGSIGGVARRTRETMLVCEAAGFDLVLVESVGVGQSEVALRSMVDYFSAPFVAGRRRRIAGHQEEASWKWPMTFSSTRPTATIACALNKPASNNMPPFPFCNRPPPAGRRKPAFVRPGQAKEFRRSGNASSVFQRIGA